MRIADRESGRPWQRDTLQVIFSGHYHDEFARTAGTWHFTRTVVHKPIIGNMSQHLRSEDFVRGG